MPYNLLREPWIPVRRRSGAIDWIAPWQLAETDDPAVALSSPRPDFDGALLQFLIGLLQTTVAPDGEREWEKRFDKPFTGKELKARFDEVLDAFNLDGDGPRFMQDLKLKQAEAVQLPIGALLIDRVGEEGLSENPNLFAKPYRFPLLGRAAAAAALYGLQANAPAGGKGHMTSLRGGGPICTVILGETLFRTAWLNVLPEPEMNRFGNPRLTKLEAKFPWMGPTRISEAKAGGKGTTLEDIHPVQHYWGMPRRVRLDFSNAAPGDCAAYGRAEDAVLTSCFARHSGVSYEGDFRHPLTPYTKLTAGEPLNPKKGRSGGIPYREWPDLVTGDDDHLPARVVEALKTNAGRRRRVPTPRLAAFGFEMDKMKPRSWIQAVTPIVLPTEGTEADFAHAVSNLVEASEKVRLTLVGRVKEAVARRPEDLGGDLPSVVNAAYWSQTEAAFFEAVMAVRDALPAPMPEAAANSYLEALHRAALALFEVHAQTRADFAAADVRRVAVAWDALKRFTSPRNGALRALVGLAPPEPKKPNTRKKKEVRT